jgi:twitching motility protein PilI
MVAARAGDPFGILQAADRLARRVAPGLPLAQEVRQRWVGIGFRLAGQALVMPVDEVRELLRYPRLSRVPGTHVWVRGVANVRGRLLTVIDLQGCLGGELETVTRRSRVLALRDEAASVGLLVEEAPGLKHFFLEDRTRDVRGFPSWLSEYLRGAFMQGATPWGVLDGQALLDSPPLNRMTL